MYVYTHVYTTICSNPWVPQILQYWAKTWQARPKMLGALLPSTKNTLGVYCSNTNSALIYIVWRFWMLLGCVVLCWGQLPVCFVINCVCVLESIIEYGCVCQISEIWPWQSCRCPQYARLCKQGKIVISRFLVTIFQKMFLVAREILVTNGSYSIRVRLPVFGNSMKLPSPEMRNESVLIIPSAIKLCRS